MKKRTIKLLTKPNTTPPARPFEERAEDTPVSGVMQMNANNAIQLMVTDQELISYTDKVDKETGTVVGIEPVLAHRDKHICPGCNLQVGYEYVSISKGGNAIVAALLGDEPITVRWHIECEEPHKGKHEFMVEYHNWSRTVN